MVDDAVTAFPQHIAEGVQGLLRVEPDLVGGWVGRWVGGRRNESRLSSSTHPPTHPPTNSCSHYLGPVPRAGGREGFGEVVGEGGRAVVVERGVDGWVEGG